MKTRWSGIEMYQVLFVLAVPAEFSDKSKAILRECAFDAKLINKKNSYKLQFTTERKQDDKSYFTQTLYISK